MLATLFSSAICIWFCCFSLTRHSSALFWAASLLLLIFPIAPLSFVLSTFLLLAHPLPSSSSLNTGDWLSPLHFILTASLSSVFSPTSPCSVNLIFPQYFCLSLHLSFCPSYFLLIHQGIIMFYSMFRDICTLHLRMKSSIEGNCIRHFSYMGSGMWLI